MDSGVFVGIDHGGTMTTALVFDPERGKVSSHGVLTPKRMPQFGWAEHEPEDFVKSSLAAASGAVEEVGLSWFDARGSGAGQISVDDIHALERKAVICEPSIGCDEREALWGAAWRQSVKQVCERTG